jgi:hypothetical protein
MIAAMHRRLIVAVGLVAGLAALGRCGGGSTRTSRSATADAAVSLPAMGAGGRCPVAARHS